MNTPKTERIQTVVIGGGQAGLSVGYHLSRRGLPFVILDANKRVGDAWRNRWDSLRLFTAARYDGLDGLPVPAPQGDFITKDEMAGYLEQYAKHFKLPIRSGVKVERVSKLPDIDGAGYLVTAEGQRIEAENVIVAMSNYQRPRVPAFAKELDPSIVQLHSSAYRNPKQLREGAALLVGAGNSGAEIAIDVSRGRKTFLSGRDVGHVPFRSDGFLGRHLLARLVLRFIFHRVLTTGTAIGRKLRPQIISKGAPLIRQKPRDLAAAHVERVVRVVGAKGGKPLLEDGRALDVQNVIWCTGFYPGLEWLDVPVTDKDGEPIHDRGVVAGQPGLFFVGQHFLYAMSSVMIHGVGRDAEHVVEALAARTRTARAA